ncbi:hypothetical protein NHF46_01030 [Arthrobacter alpinus]|nr:hypothetical protein [Arthrobacter alpinus]
MTDFVDLMSCEAELLEEETEDLFRQVTAHHWDDQVGRPLAAAFGPSDSDQGKASYTRSTKVSAEDSRNWHNDNARSASKGVFKVTVDEVVKASLRAVDDSGCPIPEGEKRAPGHCFVDFQHVKKKEERRLRAILYAKALAWGEITEQSV